jgi:hypothetical protein
MPQLSFFLKQERERLGKLIAKPEPELPSFLWIDVANEKIAKISKASADQAKIALFAWNEALPQVETRSPNILTKELNGKGIKLDGPQPDLYDWLSPRPQKDAEWTARTALIEYTLVKPLDYQGTAGTFIRTGDGQALNLNDILPQLLQSQIGSLLKDLNLDGTTKPQSSQQWYKPAIELAEAAKARGFRVTQVTVDPASFRATVESRFLVQISAGNWKTAWKFLAAEDGTKPRPQLEARIEQDPQMKSVTDTVKSLGLNNATALQQAIRFGAATMAAQEAVDAAFGEFRERFSRQLDGPPLRFPSDD